MDSRLSICVIVANVVLHLKNTPAQEAAAWHLATKAPMLLHVCFKWQLYHEPS